MANKNVQVVPAADAKDYESTAPLGKAGGYLRTRIKTQKREWIRRITQGKKGK